MDPMYKMENPDIQEKKSIFSDQNGKKSSSRLFLALGFSFACLLAMFAIGMAAFSNNSAIISSSTPIIIAFLTFAGGLKVGSGFSERKI